MEWPHQVNYHVNLKTSRYLRLLLIKFVNILVQFNKYAAATFDDSPRLLEAKRPDLYTRALLLDPGDRNVWGKASRHQGSAPGPRWSERLRQTVRTPTRALLLDPSDWNVWGKASRPLPGLCSRTPVIGASEANRPDAYQGSAPGPRWSELLRQSIRTPTRALLPDPGDRNFWGKASRPIPGLCSWTPVIGTSEAKRPDTYQGSAPGPRWSELLRQSVRTPTVALLLDPGDRNFCRSCPTAAIYTTSTKKQSRIIFSITLFRADEIFIKFVEFVPGSTQDITACSCNSNEGCVIALPETFHFNDVLKLKQRPL